MNVERARKESYFKKRGFSEGFSVPISTLENTHKAPCSAKNQRLMKALYGKTKREDCPKMSISGAGGGT